MASRWLIASVLVLAALVAAGFVDAQAAKKPNFVIIFTDDQDAIQNSTHPHYMPALHKWIRSPGIELSNYFVSTPVCCPSRTNLLRGQYSHNTNFTDVLAPHGGYAKWKQLGIDKSYLPVWLQELGYNTYWTGKFLVDYSVRNYNNTPAGFTDIDALLQPFMFDYGNPGFSRNGAAPVQYPGQYSTDVVADKGVAQLKSAIASGKPFFNVIAPIAPHTSTQFKVNPETGLTDAFFFPPVPAPRHWELFSDATLPTGTPRSNLYEKDVSDKPAWIRALPLAQQNNRTYLEEVYRLRLRSLASVDELVDRVLRTLNESGVLDNTYVIYTGDNGYHVGTHRFGAGKVLGYEEELRVPFLIRGPGIKASRSSKPVNAKVGLHVDLAPTILTLAGAGDQLGSKALDGTPLGIYADDDGTLPASYPRPEYHRQEFPAAYWGPWWDEVLHHIPDYNNNTWKAVRVWEEERNGGYKLIVSCTNERELYDLRVDPGELKNIYKSSSTSKRLKNRLEALLAVLAVCKGDSCRDPWKLIHPSGGVHNLRQALASKYDSVYESIKPFSFRSCLDFQLHENEYSQFRAQIEAQAAAAAGAQGRRRAEEKAAAAAAARRRAQQTGGAEQEAVTVVANVERFGVPFPDYVLQGDMYSWFVRTDMRQLKIRLA